MLNIIRWIYPPSDRKEMAIIGKTKIVVMIPVHLLQIMDTCVTLLSLKIQISAAKTPESIYSVLYYLNNDGMKCRI